MCSQLVTVMTLLATLLHSALGCCWHHVHVCDCGSAGPLVQVEPVETAHKTHCCGSPAGSPCEPSAPAHDDHAPADPASPAHQHNSCTESHCVFVNSRTQDGCWPQHLALSLELPPPLVVNPPTGPVASGRMAFSSPLPIGAHQWRAQLQVWLI